MFFLVNTISEALEMVLLFIRIKSNIWILDLNLIESNQRLIWIWSNNDSLIWIWSNQIKYKFVFVFDLIFKSNIQISNLIAEPYSAASEMLFLLSKT